MKCFTGPVLVLGICIFAACGKFEVRTSEEVPANVDSLMTVFKTAWNTHDTAKVLSLIMDDAVLLTNETQLNGKPSIAQHFVYPNIPNVHSLETNKMTQGTSCGLAYESGTYNLGVVRNDTIVGNSSGNYTLIWKRIGEKDWLLENIHMEGKIEELK